jgi:hypothetical protein
MMDRATESVWHGAHQHDLRHTFVSRLAGNSTTSEQTIRTLAGHASRQMMEHYSHTRSQTKQAAIRTLEVHEQEWILTETEHKSGHTCKSDDSQKGANSLQTKNGPARI